jgi:hypothetical protein
VEGIKCQEMPLTALNGTIKTLEMFYHTQTIDESLASDLCAFVCVCVGGGVRGGIMTWKCDVPGAGVAPSV